MLAGEYIWFLVTVTEIWQDGPNIWEVETMVSNGLILTKESVTYQTLRLSLSTPAVVAAPSLVVESLAISLANLAVKFIAIIGVRRPMPWSWFPCASAYNLLSQPPPNHSKSPTGNRWISYNFLFKSLDTDVLGAHSRNISLNCTISLSKKYTTSSSAMMSRSIPELRMRNRETRRLDRKSDELCMFKFPCQFRLKLILKEKGSLICVPIDIKCMKNKRMRYRGK